MYNSREMKKTIVVILCCCLTAAGTRAQNVPAMVQNRLALIKKRTDKTERILHTYATRKFGFTLSVSPYCNITHASGFNPFGVLDINFTDRFKFLDFMKNGRLEEYLGIGFEPYQGTRLNVGSSYDLFSRKYKVNAYLGGQYSFGLAQANTFDNLAFCNVGFHHYLLPFVGITYAPGKKDISRAKNMTEADQYQFPTSFWRLLYFKFQVGYSFLVSKLQVDTTGKFLPGIYDIIRNNTGNTLNVKFCVGISIPGYGKRKRQYYNYLQANYMLIRD